jgi:hypothetical protein
MILLTLTVLEYIDSGEYSQVPSTGTAGKHQAQTQGADEEDMGDAEDPTATDKGNAKRHKDPDVCACWHEVLLFRDVIIGGYDRDIRTI